LTLDIDIMADLIVNHMSRDSAQFCDYLAHAGASPYDGLFLTRERVFPRGVSPSDLQAIYRPRPGTPFTPVTLADGTVRFFWTTFTPHQIDIDVQHPTGAAYLRHILATFGANGIRMVRLDAVGYAIKKAGTSCFMLPETFDFIAALAAEARACGIEVLVEIHSYYRKQIEIARHVDRVYDFALPPLLLHAFEFGTGRYLAAWIQIRPHNAITVLDTHDGIGIIDIGPDRAEPLARPGLVPAAELEELVERIHHNTAGESRRATGAAASNLDLYQVNCTFYDAMRRDDLRYLLARAVQFFLPGVPQVYYVGLLAGSNDLEILARSGVGRDINRHYYTEAELEIALARPVVRELCRLIRLRNEHPAFGGTFAQLAAAETAVHLRWTAGLASAELQVDFATDAYTLAVSSPAGLEQFEFALG
jgi:sucrose phosphorylase